MREVLKLELDKSFTFGTRTAALSFPGGTVKPLEKVAASPEYRELMYRLSLPSSQHPAPPYRDWDDYLRDIPRQEMRKSRKAAGLPASEDCAVIGNMLRSLRGLAEESLNRTVSYATVVAPNLLALYEEDLTDAFEWIELEYLKDRAFREFTPETSAAYVGYGGFGLCENYFDIDSCRREERAMPRDRVLSVLFTNSALFVGNDVTGPWWWLWEPQYRVHMNFSLGYGHRFEYVGVEYARLVGETLRHSVIEYPDYHRPNKVLLQGECAHLDKFREILHIALADLIDDVPSKIYGNNTLFVVAEGAAEMAKRLAWTKFHANLASNQPDLNDKSNLDL